MTTSLGPPFFHRNNLRDIFLILALVVVVFLIYSNTFRSPFILDDWSNITSVISIRVEELSLKEFVEAARDSRIATRPLANITFAVNYFLHEFRLPGYHFVNILIHASAGIFLYMFFRITLLLESQRQRIKFSNFLPFTAALIWIVHPLHIQSVTYIVQRMNSMAAMFYILAMLLYVKGRLAPAVQKKIVFFTGCLVSWLLALGSKEIAATLPFFILLYEWYFLQDLRVTWLKKRLLPITSVGVLLAAIVLFYVGTNPVAWIQSSYGIRDFTITQRVLTEFRVVVFYISQVFLPHPSRLNLDHHVTLSSSLSDPVTTLLSFGLLSAMFIGAIILAKRQRLVSFGILWFLGNMVIESSFIGLEIIFEHRTYLPSMLFVLSILVVGDRSLKAGWLKTGIVMMVVLVFSTWTYQRNMAWQEELILARDSAAKSPGKPRAQMVLAKAFERLQKYDEAAVYYSKALELNPPNGAVIVHYNLANVLVKQKKYREAVRHYQEAMALGPNIDVIRINLANAFELEGKADDAIEVLDELLLLDPENGKAHYNLGVINMKLGRLASAEYHYSEAVRLGFVIAAINLEKVKKERVKRARENFMFLRSPGSQRRDTKQ
jgi:hypothetical protein